MRILSLRLIVALVLGVTLASFASSWYQVQAEKDALRLDLQRKAETFSESLAGISEYHLQSGDRAGLSESSSDSAIVTTSRASVSMTPVSFL